MAETSSGTILNLLFVDGCSREGKGGGEGGDLHPVYIVYKLNN